LPYVFRDFGGAGEATRYACGFLGYDQPFNPMLATLPRLMHVTAGDGGTELIADAARAALRESERPGPGTETFLGKLGELVFLQAIRQHIGALPREATGWFAGLRDRHIGQALALMHGEPAARWSVETLAQGVGLSRSAFADRFTLLVGTPPMQYLSDWRLQLAAHKIEAQGLSIARAAAAIGYESESAFHRAFKKRVGLPPGSWRRARLGTPRA
jgi:AraC-like DNA-binding protein